MIDIVENIKPICEVKKEGVTGTIYDAPGIVAEVKPPPVPEVVISSGWPRSNVGGAVPTGSFSISAIDKKWFAQCGT